jgi:hypothetical protein
MWLTIAPAALGYRGLPRDNDHVVGPIVAACACIALWQATRPVGWVNPALGAWLLVAPWLFSAPASATVNALVVGALLIALAWVGRGSARRLGGGWASLFAPESMERRSGEPASPLSDRVSEEGT